VAEPRFVDEPASADLQRAHRGSAEPLTIIGASVRAAAQSARRASFAPIAGDLFADVDLRETCLATRIEDYPQGLERVLDGHQSGGWMYTGALENYFDLIERWSAMRPLYGNPAEVLHRVRDPLQVADSLRRAGLTCPAVSLSCDHVPRDGSWLRKPLRSAGGRRIAHWNNDAAEPVDYPMYFQQFVAGTPYAAVYVATRGNATLLGVTRQLIDNASFRYVGSIGPISSTGLLREVFTNIGQELATEFELVGLFGVDALVNATGVWPVEVNPRYTASVEVLERALGINAITLHMTACREGTLPGHLPPSASRVAGKTIYFAENDFTIDEDLRNVIDNLADVPAVGTLIRKREPVVTVLREANDETAVLRTLQMALETISSCARAMARH
jgi:uncharacterized protein